MRSIKKWWRQLWCNHFYNLDHLPIVDIVYGKGFLKAYTCIFCHKEIHRFNDPINNIEPGGHHEKISLKIGKILLIILMIPIAIYIFFTLYELLDYFNIGADGS